MASDADIVVMISESINVPSRRVTYDAEGHLLRLDLGGLDLAYLPME